MSLPNTNPLTGISYGIITANDMDPDIVDTLMFGRNVTDHTFLAAIEQDKAEKLAVWEASGGYPSTFEYTDRDEQEFCESYECNERRVSGTYEDVSYLSSYLGGALHFFIVHSPIITNTAKSPSPCVPNSGILPSGEGSVTCYDVPQEWLHDHG